MSKLSDESPSDTDESPFDASMKVHLTGDEIPPRRSLSTSSQVPAKKDEPAVKRATSLFSFLDPPPTEAGKGGHPNLEESSPDGLSSIPTQVTLAGLRAKEKHASAHGGIALEELNQLRTQIAFMEAGS
jgi:hypothetical protein